MKPIPKQTFRRVSPEAAREAAGEAVPNGAETYLWKELKRHESRRCREQQLPPVGFTLDRKTRHKYLEIIGTEAIYERLDIYMNKIALRPSLCYLR